MFIRNILLLMVLISGQTYTQNVTYSKTGNGKIYTVAAPDKSIEFVFLQLMVMFPIFILMVLGIVFLIIL